MKVPMRLVCWGCVMGLFVGGQAGALGSEAGPRYRVPEGAGAGARVNGAYRGKVEGVPSIYVLAPDHVGLTLQEQPDLFWYQSEPSDIQFELSMTVDGKAEPVLEVSKPRATAAGIVRLDLRAHGVHLQKDVEYKWSVALIVDPKNPSRSLIASGYIRRMSPSAGISARLLRPNQQKVVQALAEFGIWYDALAQVSDMIDASPDSNELREWRSSLLAQVQLDEPAQFDRRGLTK